MHNVVVRGAPLLALALALAPTALAQAAEKPFKLQDALNAPDWLAVSGSVRLRAESLANQFTAGRRGDDSLLETQSLLKLEAKGNVLAAGLEVLDARRLAGDTAGAAAGVINTLEPIQAYLSWRPTGVFTPEGKLDVTLGRFTLDLGSRRVIARSNHSFLQQSYTGARAVWTGKDGLAATAFVTRPTLRLPADAPSAIDNDIELDEDAEAILSGGLLVMPIAKNTTIDLYAYDLDEDDAPGQATRNRDLLTYGVRARLAPQANALDYEIDYARQTGRSRATTGASDVTDLKHDAYMMHLETGYSFKAPWSPRLALQYDQATGDKSPTDGRMQRFDALFGDRTFDLGFTAINSFVGRTNFSSPAIRLEVKPNADWDGYLAVRQIKLDQARDSFAASNVRDASGASGKDVGTQIEARARLWLVPQTLRLSVGGDYVDLGRFMRDAPNATREGDPLYGFIEMALTF